MSKKASSLSYPDNVLIQRKLSTQEYYNVKLVADNMDAVIESGAPEGTSVKSTGEMGGIKFLRENGNGTSSWYLLTGGGDLIAVNNLADLDNFAAARNNLGVDPAGTDNSDPLTKTDVENVLTGLINSHTHIGIAPPASIGEIGDVDTTTNPPNTGDDLIWDGNNWVTNMTQLIRDVKEEGDDIYIGEAAPNTLTSVASWRLYKVSSVSANPSKRYADGNSDFDNIMDDYLTKTYP